MPKAMFLLLLAAVTAFCAAPCRAGPPAYSCDRQCDYYNNCTTVCAASNCNAQQRNLGGGLLVLDLDSYNMRRQGSNPYIPATCCQACQDTDGCNAWVSCTKPEGCGSGCSAYAKQFKLPTDYSDPLPLKYFGNFKNCLGDRWPANTCSLKFINDTNKPPVVPNGAAEGWVSGIVPKPTNLDKRCPPGTSAKTCSTCLATKDPASCLKCQATALRLGSLSSCATCANIADPAARAACVRCVAPGKGARAAECADCMGANSQNSGTPSMPFVEACFSCVAKAQPGAVSQCPRCFQSWTVGQANFGACSTCVQKSNSTAAAAACPTCYDATVKDKPGCLTCASKAKTADNAAGCGLCANTNNVLDAYVAQCRDCVFKSPAAAKSYCYNTVTRVPASKAATAALQGYYKCLQGSKDSNYAQGCMFCYRDAVESSGAGGPSCYSCVTALPNSFNANSCSSCWSDSRMAKGKTCEACVRSKPSGTYAFDCYN